MLWLAPGAEAQEATVRIEHVRRRSGPGDAARLRAALHRQRRTLRFCHEEYVQRFPGAGGRVDSS